MSVNKVILIGYVGNEPQIRYLENRMRIANFSLATSEPGYTLSNGIQVPEKTEWHNIVAWDRLGEYTERFVHKGSLLYIEGKIRSRIYDDKSGIRRYVYEILATNINVLQQSKQQNNNTSSAKPNQ